MKILIRKNKKKLKSNHICWQDTVKEDKLENQLDMLILLIVL